MDTVGTEIVLPKTYKHRRYIAGLCCQPGRKTNVARVRGLSQASSKAWATKLSGRQRLPGPTELEEEHQSAQSRKGSI
jgi:hypothetical protein